MKAFIRAVDRFCARHPKFGISRLIQILVIGMGIVFVLNLLDSTGTFLHNLFLDPQLILEGEIWRVITWIICPIDQIFLDASLSSIVITALTLYFYYYIGSTLEREWGAAKFTLFYISGVLLNIIYAFAVWIMFRKFFFVSTLYLNLSMFLAFAVMFPNQVIMAFMIIPVKVKWLAMLDAAIFVVFMLRSALAGDFVSAVFPAVALLNFFLFCGYDLISHFTGGPKRSKQAISFKKAAKKAKREQDHATYRHKCAVCGKTDVSNPGMEFRYCSRCEGYHCFCADHINNHIHFN